MIRAHGFNLANAVFTDGSLPDDVATLIGEHYLRFLGHRVAMHQVYQTAVTTPSMDEARRYLNLVEQAAA
jgi:hypothetical protein